MMTEEELLDQLTRVASLGDGEDISSFILDCFSLHAHRIDQISSVLLAVLADPNIPGGSDFQSRKIHMQNLPKQKGSKSRCDAQWYAKDGLENIAFGCKTCAKSSASCICVSCFEAGDHEGHDFYVSKSDYGCCDCGDSFAWSSSGFCGRHSGPTDDPCDRLNEWNVRVGRQVISAIARAIESFPDCQKELLELLLVMARSHDGFRRIIGQELLQSISDSWTYSLVDALLPKSHLLPVSARHLWTNLVVDLMLDLDFKSNFSHSFFNHYSQMVLDRALSQSANRNSSSMSDIGDFTCQILTRPDVAVALVREKNLIKVVLKAIQTILGGALMGLGEFELLDQGPSHLMGGGGQSSLRVIDHRNSAITNQTAFQCSMDLIYVMDHPEVMKTLTEEPVLLMDYWANWIEIMEYMQFMNPHRKRNDVHVEFPDPHWSAPLTTQSDLFMSFFMLMDYLSNVSSSLIYSALIDHAKKSLMNWIFRFEKIPRNQNIQDEVYSIFCPLNRILALTIFHFIDQTPQQLQSIISFQEVLHLIELPIESIVFNSETALGLWRRNGDSVSMESEFYKAPFFHHHMNSADLLAARIAIIHPHTCLESLFTLWAHQFNFSKDAKTCLSTQMNGFLQFLAQLMSQQTELSLDELGLVKHRVVAALAIQDKTFSQLRDPKLERWTHTLMPKHNEMLENCLEEVGVKTVAGRPELSLSDSGWLHVDMVSPHWTWRDFHKAEERLFAHLKQKRMNLSDWFKCNSFLQPVMKPQFHQYFRNFISSEFLIATILVVSRRLLVDRSDSRSLKLLIQMLLRLCYPFGPSWMASGTSICKTGIVLRDGDDEGSIESIANAWKLHVDQCKCSPLLVAFNKTTEYEISSFSILSTLQELNHIEKSNDLKEWLQLCISQISLHSGILPVEPKFETPPHQAHDLEKDSYKKLLQQQLLSRLHSRQERFIRSSTPSSTPLSDNKNVFEKMQCVVCLDTNDIEKSIGKLCFVSQSCLNCFEPRPFSSSSHSLMNFDPHVGQKRNVITRTCNHAIHLDCWKNLIESNEASFSTRGFILCPYCSRPANLVLGNDTAIRESESHSPLFESPEHLISCQIDQIALSLRKPNPESDIPALTNALPLLLRLFETSQPSGSSFITECTQLDSNDFKKKVNGYANYFKIEHQEIFSSTQFVKILEMCMLSWLWKCHVIFHYIVPKSTHELPFEEIASIESALSISDEFALLVEQLPGTIKIDSIENCLSDSSSEVLTPPIICFDVNPLLPESRPPNQIEPKFFDSFLKRDKSVRYIQCDTVRFVEYFPSIIPMLPSVYQRLFTSFLSAKCIECDSVPRRGVICLICGSLLCFNSECCQVGELGEVSKHYLDKCSENGIGIFLQLSNSEIHLISSDRGRILLSQWGSLYLDSHGEEDFGLSKPLQLNQGRLQKLSHEIRENSWLWRQSSKSLVWRKPIGIL